MGRLRSLIALPAAAALLGLGTGCAGGGFWKNRPADYPPETTGARTKTPDAGVVPAGGTSPLASVPASLSWLGGKADKAPKAGGPVTLAPAWRNHIDYLPDPARRGAMGPGLAGQIFAFGANDMPAALDGTLTVELYDETKRPAGVPANKAERWTFNRDVLKALRAVDERFGPNYVVFLPWPAYRPDVTRVRITVKYEPADGSFPIYAPETRMALDPSLAGAGTSGGGTIQPALTTPSASVAPAGGPAAATTNPPAAGAVPSATTGPGMGVMQISRSAAAQTSTGTTESAPLKLNGALRP
jgi:hypothetical protein